MTSNLCQGIVIDPGETDTCTITNVKQGTITIVKDAQPDDLQDFNFTGTAPIGAFTLDDDANCTVTDCGTGGDINQPQSDTTNNLPANTTYTVTESLPNQFWILKSISCVMTGTSDPYTNVSNTTNGVVITLDPGADVTCTFVNEKILPTRTQGFWKNHTTFTTNILGSMVGGMTIGNPPTPITGRTITTAPELFGAYEASIPQKSNKQKRTSLDQARMQLVKQLITAKLNCAAFGCNATIIALIASADTAYTSGTAATILSLASQLDAYNNSGDTLIISPPLPVPGKATPKDSKAIANISLWDILP